MSCALVRADRRSRERQSTGVVTNQPKQLNFITYNVKIPHSFGKPISQLSAQTDKKISSIFPLPPPEFIFIPVIRYSALSAHYNVTFY